MPIPATDPIPFGEMSPDLGDFFNPGALMVRNAICQGDRYKPFGEVQVSGSGFPNGEMARGGFSYRDAAGNVIIFAATSTKIYRRNGLTWDDVTRTTGGDYTTPPDGYWNFVNFGNLIIGTNYVDDIQCFDAATSTEFEEMSPTAPRARFLWVQNNYLMGIDIVDADGATPYRVRWSPLADPRGDWTPNPEITGADFQDIYGGDYPNVFGAALAAYGVIVQGKELWQVNFTGGTDIFSIEPLEIGIGSLLGRSCASNGHSIFFLGEDGFYEFDGAALNPIGNGKIDTYFYKNFNEVYDYNMNTIVDPLKKNILWSFPSNSSNGTPDLILCLNWPTKRFTVIEQDAQMLFCFLSVGYTMEGLDAITTNLDLLPFSLDSRIWTGGKTILGCITGAGLLGAFNGAPKTALIGTGEIRGNTSGRATLQSVIPYIEGGSFRARCGTRNRIGDAVTFTPFVTQNPYTGEIDFGKDAVFHRVEVEISGTWDIATAIAPRMKATGAA